MAAAPVNFVRVTTAHKGHGKGKWGRVRTEAATFVGTVLTPVLNLEASADGHVLSCAATQRSVNTSDVQHSLLNHQTLLNKGFRAGCAAAA